MILKKLTFLLIFFAQQVSAQLHLQFMWGTEHISLGKTYYIGKDSIKFDELKMYLSDFHFQKQTRQHHIQGVQLIDLAEDQSLTLFPDFPVSEYESMSFRFGLDSSYHVSESVEGDLDPLKGMYWAWNSGYIQFKCTGTSSSIPLTDQTFEYHLGGYRQPVETVLPMEIKIKGNKLILNIKPFFDQTVDFQQVQRVMIPGKMAKTYCQELAKFFRSE